MGACRLRAAREALKPAPSAAALVVRLLGRRMNRTPLQTAGFGPEGRQVVPKARHALYHVRMESWGPILFVLCARIVLARA